MTTTSRRRPFDQHAETQSPQPGEAFSYRLARRLDAYGREQTTPTTP